MCDDGLYSGGLKTKNSIQYFHPKIDVVIYGTSEIERVKKKYEIDDSLWSSAPCIIDDYLELNGKPDLLIKIDADCLVLDSLDEVFNLSYEVASARNDPDQVGDRDERHNRPDIIRDIPNWEWVNAGFVAIRNFDFASRYLQKVLDYKNGVEYALKDYGKVYRGDDMSALNVVFRLGGFKTEILDKLGSGLIYGSSGNWCSGVKYGETVNNWASWKNIILKDGKPFLGNRKVKVLHQGGGIFRGKLNYDLFNDEFRKYVQKVTQFEN